MDWASLVSAGIGHTNSLIGTIVGGVQSRKNREQQQKLLDFQKSQWSWEKSAYHDMQNREDTAVQRRVADLESAGLHPVLAAGSGAAAHAPPSQPAGLTAPQGRTDYLDYLMESNIVKQYADAKKAFAEAGYINRQNSHLDDVKGLLNAQAGHYERSKEHFDAMEKLIGSQISHYGTLDRMTLDQIITAMQHRDVIQWNLDEAKSRGLAVGETTPLITTAQHMIDRIESVYDQMLSRLNELVPRQVFDHVRNLPKQAQAAALRVWESAKEGFGSEIEAIREFFRRIGRR